MRIAISHLKPNISNLVQQKRFKAIAFQDIKLFKIVIRCFVFLLKFVVMCFTEVRLQYQELFERAWHATRLFLKIWHVSSFELYTPDLRELVGLLVLPKSGKLEN